MTHAPSTIAVRTASDASSGRPSAVRPRDLARSGTRRRSRGTREIVGEALINNRPLLEMVRRLGFEVHPAVGEGTAVLRLPLQQPQQEHAP